VGYETQYCLGRGLWIARGVRLLPACHVSRVKMQTQRKCIAGLLSACARCTIYTFNPTLGPNAGSDGS
jgi:hypothetical protein